MYVFSILKNILFEMASWCNNYISRVDKSVIVVNEDLLRWHAVFYSICQALFYIISFRHQDLTDNKRSKFFIILITYQSFEQVKLNIITVIGERSVGLVSKGQVSILTHSVIWSKGPYLLVKIKMLSLHSQFLNHYRQ